MHIEADILLLLRRIYAVRRMSEARKRAIKCLPILHYNWLHSDVSFCRRLNEECTPLCLRSRKGSRCNVWRQQTPPYRQKASVHPRCRNKLRVQCATVWGYIDSFLWKPIKTLVFILNHLLNGTRKNRTPLNELVFTSRSLNDERLSGHRVMASFTNGHPAK